MKKNKIFSKFNLKNYNDELEEILETKVFSFDVKNLLLSMLYKIENAYKDYKSVKYEVLSINDIIEYIIKTIRDKCFDIEFILPEEDKKVVIDQKKGKIICYPNETSLLSSVWYIGEENAPVVAGYPYEKEAIEYLLKIGSNISIAEVLRDFNGWSWDTLIGEIENLDYNILYQSLLLLDGKRLFNLNIECDEKNSILIQKDKKEYAEFFRVLANCTLNLYKKENKEISELNCLEEYNNAVNKILEENWIDTYIALHLLSEKIREKNIKLNISATKNGILENMAMFMIWILVDEEEKLEGGIGFSNTIPKKYIENMSAEEIESKYKDKVFIQVKAEDKTTVEQMLDELSNNWQENIMVD